MTGKIQTGPMRAISSSARCAASYAVFSAHPAQRPEANPLGVPDVSSFNAAEVV